MVGFWEKYGLEGKGNSSKPKKEQTDEQLTPAKTKNNSDDKDKSDKKRRTTNDLSELAEILEEAKNKTDTPKAEKGESEMADVNNDERGLVVVNNGNKKGNETAITDEMEVNLTSLEVKACALAGIDLKDFIGKSKDEIKAIWEKKDYFIDGDRILYKGKPVEQSEINAAILKHIITPLHPDKNIIGDKNKSTKLFQNIHSVLTKGGKFKLRQTTEEYPNIDGILKKPLSLENKKNKNTELAVIPKTEIVKYKDEQDTPPQPTPAEHTDMHWIDEKIRDYTKMKEDGKAAIKEFNGDKTAGTFTAEIDNGTVTYTSPNDVSVTKDSSYKVFDTMMKEPSNAGKAVRLPEDATAEFRTNLFVAAVLNGHKVNGAEGFELDEATLAKINLEDKQIAQVRAALSKQEKAPAEKTTQEKPAEEKPSEKVTENEPLPGPYNPAQHRINHVLERKNMLAALAKGTAENVKPVNPDKATFIFKNAQNPMNKGGRDE